MIWVIVGIIAAALTSVALGILYFRRKREMSDYYLAAYKVVKETYLNDALKRKGAHVNSQTLKPMVYIKNLKGGKERFVFDPEWQIGIGRVQEDNVICVRDMRVSAHHCRIFLYAGNLFLEDLGSSNGTWIKQGLFKKQVLSPCPLNSGDKLYIGSQIFKIIIFNFNTMLL